MQTTYCEAEARVLIESSMLLGEFADLKKDGVYSKEKRFWWTPSCELDGPDSPNPLTAPGLPIPFTANQLAAFMLDGIGWFVTCEFGEFGDGIDEEVLASMDDGYFRTVKDALRSAYTAFRTAASIVGWPDEAHALALQVQKLDQELQAELTEADQAEGAEGAEGQCINVDDDSQKRISNEKHWDVRCRARESLGHIVEALRAARKRSDQAEAVAWPAWRKAMVNELLPRKTELSAVVQALEVEISDPERRLAALRSLGGTSNYQHGEWRFEGITKLVKSEAGRDRNDPKTIRKDLRVAAEAERDAKKSGDLWRGLR